MKKRLIEKLEIYPNEWGGDGVGTDGSGGLVARGGRAGVKRSFAQEGDGFGREGEMTGGDKKLKMITEKDITTYR